MSRREGRDSHGSKRLHSRFDREPPSPKKSRRDGKPATEKKYSSNHHLDAGDNADHDQRHRQRLQDALPLEDPPETETKVKTDAIKEGLDGKVDGLPVGNKHSSDPKDVSRSRSYSQHDERGSTRHGGGRSSGRRTTEYGRWSDPKEQSHNRPREKVDPRQPHARDNSVWRHDGFSQLEAEAPPARKRPAFREKKIETEIETAAAATDPESSKLPAARMLERGQYSCGENKKLERPLPRADERNFKRRGDTYQRAETQRGGYQSRERFGGGGARGNDMFGGRYGERNASWSSGFQVEKWKHDLYDEANRSPTPKNEEEQIAKIEALLAL